MFTTLNEWKNTWKHDWDPLFWAREKRWEHGKIRRSKLAKGSAQNQRCWRVFYDKKHVLRWFWCVSLKGIVHFDHNFSKSPRIDFRFFTVAKLKKLNNFYLGRIEDWPMKKSRNRVFTPYLARARARARPSPTSWELGLRPSPTRGSHREPTRGRACGFPQHILRTSRFARAVVVFSAILIRNALWRNFPLIQWSIFTQMR